MAATATGAWIGNLANRFGECFSLKREGVRFLILRETARDFARNTVNGKSFFDPDLDAPILLTTVFRGIRCDWEG